MRLEEQAQIDAARAQIAEAQAVLATIRAYRVKAKGTWEQLGDLDPAAERDLKEALREILKAWAGRHDVKMDIDVPDLEVQQGDWYAFQKLS